MVLPDNEHHECMVLYSPYNLDCKHRTRTFLNRIKYYVSLLIVPCYKENNIIKTYFYNKHIVRWKSTSVIVLKSYDSFL